MAPRIGRVAQHHLALRTTVVFAIAVLALLAASHPPFLDGDTAVRSVAVSGLWYRYVRESSNSHGRTPTC